jgi:hypothetical protein
MIRATSDGTNPSVASPRRRGFVGAFVVLDRFATRRTLGIFAGTRAVDNRPTNVAPPVTRPLAYDAATPGVARSVGCGRTVRDIDDVQHRWADF